MISPVLIKKCKRQLLTPYFNWVFFCILCSTNEGKIKNEKTLYR